MGKALLTLWVVCMLLIDPVCQAQTSVRISEPKLEFSDNTLHISYDILNSGPDEKYMVTVNMTDEDGNVINAAALKGDLGLIEDGGSDKHVTWDLEADNISMNAYVYVTIHAKVIPPPEPEPEIAKTGEEDAGKEEVALQDESEASETGQAAVKEEPPPATRTKSFNRTAIVIQSLVLPGLGLSRVAGKPHWIRGVAGYGCVAGAVIMNRKAISTFNTIEDLDDVRDAKDAFDHSVRRDHISEAFAYTAVGIWAADLIWTIIGTSDLTQKPLFGKADRFSFSSNLDPLSYVPMVSIRYKF